MKALKLLKELKHTMNTVELFRFVVNYDKLEKAIEELEHLSGSKQLVDNHTCENCKHYVELVKGASETICCALNLDCIRKYKPKDRWESK